MALISLFFLISSSSIFAQDEQTAFQKAAQINTIAAFRDFLRGYPNGQLASDARDAVFRIASEREAQILHRNLVRDGWDQQVLDSLIDFGNGGEGIVRQRLIDFLSAVMASGDYVSSVWSLRPQEEVFQLCVALRASRVDISFRQTSEGLLPVRFSLGNKENLDNEAATILFMWDSQKVFENYNRIMTENGTAPR